VYRALASGELYRADSLPDAVVDREAHGEAYGAAKQCTDGGSNQSTE
jgi:hypothetical protein